MTHRTAGEDAPTLELVDSRTGDERSLASMLESGPVLVYWIKTSCPTCRLAMPFVDRLAGRVGPGRVVAVAQADPADIVRFVQELGLGSVRVFAEPEPYEDADAWGLTHVPTWFFVGSSGKVEQSGSMFSQPDLEQSLIALGGTGSLFTEQEKGELPETRPG